MNFITVFNGQFNFHYTNPFPPKNQNAVLHVGVLYDTVWYMSVSFWFFGGKDLNFGKNPVILAAN